MKPIRNRIIPFGKDYIAINILGIIFVKKNVYISQRLITHERIHTLQMKELAYLPFYIIYGIEWIIRMFRFSGNTYKAYRNISFEREAYDNENNPDYLTSRQHWAQWRHHLAE